MLDSELTGDMMKLSVLGVLNGAPKFPASEVAIRKLDTRNELRPLL